MEEVCSLNLDYPLSDWGSGWGSLDGILCYTDLVCGFTDKTMVEGKFDGKRVNSSDQVMDSKFHIQIGIGASQIMLTIGMVHMVKMLSLFTPRANGMTILSTRNINLSAIIELKVRHSKKGVLVQKRLFDRSKKIKSLGNKPEMLTQQICQDRVSS